MYVFYDSEGLVTFTASGDPSIVEGRSDWVEIPEQELGDLFGWRVIEGELVLVDITQNKLQAKDLVNKRIGETRIKYITNIPGQDPIYLKKEQEARDYIADPDPNMANYPFLSAEVGITAPEAYQLAQVWLYMANAWNPLAAMLEGLRMSTLNSVDAATTITEIDAAIGTMESYLQSV